jgi:hypothetical protein
MIKHEVKARFGRADTKGEPKAVVALGAAGRDPLGQPTPEKPPIQEPPPVPPPVRAKRRFPAKAVATLAAVLALGGGVAAIAAPDDNTVPSPPPWTTSEPVDPDPAEPNPAPDPQPAESPVIGTWSGTVTDSTDTVEQAVTIDIDSFDGLGDGTLETQIGDEYCSYDLAYVETSGAEEIFEAEGDCASSMVSVEYDSDLDSLWYHEEWEYEGTSYVYSGFIDRG